MCCRMDQAVCSCVNETVPKVLGQFLFNEKKYNLVNVHSVVINRNVAKKIIGFKVRKKVALNYSATFWFR